LAGNDRLPLSYDAIRFDSNHLEVSVNNPKKDPNFAALERLKEMLDAKGYLIGSSTHDNNVLHTLAGFLVFLKGLKPKNRIGGAFGSYGWAGGAVKSIENYLKEAGISIVQEPIAAQYMPDEDEVKKCYEFGKRFAESIAQGG